ncbi:Uncharacterised protein [Staphylococcus aureus]|nr:Uncharacterised protein [Staphylococcus aureus]
MKKKKGFGLGISLIAIMLIVCIVLVIMMMTGGKKDTYYGIMKDNTTIEKMISKKMKVLKKMLNYLQIQMLKLKKVIL